MATEQPDEWFRRGHEAFRSSFPESAKQVPAAEFYVCPVCLIAFSRDALHQQMLTVDHVPPHSVGGTALALTCQVCNSRSGAEMDIHMRREADVHDFLQGRPLQEIKAELYATSGRRLPVRLSAADHQVRFMAQPHAAPPGADEALKADLVAAQHNWNDFELHVTFEPYSLKKTAGGWLRSAYLAFFSALGYRFILRPELDVVRERIKFPDHGEPPIFRIITPARAEPRLVRIDSPDDFRSFAMFYANNIVLLPRFGDVEFYKRLAAKPATKVACSGAEIPWPAGGPTFLMDATQTVA